MTMPAENPRAVVGDNTPDYEAEIAAQMAIDYGATVKEIETLLTKAKNLVEMVRGSETGKIEDQATSLTFSKNIKDIRDKSGVMKAYHQAEKAPHYRRGQGVDNFFFGWMEKLTRRKDTDKPGAADILYSFVDDFEQRKFAREKAERDEIARKAQEAAREAQRVREAEEKRQQEALAAAARARKPENIEKHTEVAAQATANVAAAAAFEQAARDDASEAKLQANAAPADLVRARSEDGDVMNTMAREFYAEVEDYSKLDGKQLWIFVSDKEKLKALKAWAKITQYKTPMAGALIGSRNKTKII